ncbi:cysteine synthase A [Pseudalkalibacillus hwajinpoensis]|uniref:cysteine synthase A n=1 Tax=Guptibacillus hwajinpoensis TaxID=208199 RepID=UPI001CD7F2EE|nr:cysteine synthase A [Pseudalkalibacillus hwajinpoensis]MCA0992359.1 cysteine synthase A [Pseudalkalibacillus hwajinpoensis]
MIYENMADLIGDTPLLKLNRVPNPNGAKIYAKLEYFNPSRSVKDRAAYSMIAKAEEDGLLKAGSTIIEPTSGNTGIGLAMNAAAKGYPAIIVMPDNATQERIKLLKAYGAKVVLTPSSEKMPGAINKAKEIAETIKGSFIPMQFENAANPDAHRTSTALEIVEAMKQLGVTPAAFISTAGTGGTVTGTGEVLKEHFPDLTVHVVEPEGSPVLSGGKPGKHKLVGTSPGFIPDILNTSVYDEIIKITDEQAYEVTRKLAREEGLLVGPSSGAAVYAAMQVAERLSPNQVVVTMTCDSGERYLSSDLFSSL